MILPTPTPLPTESLPAFRCFKMYVKLGRKRSQVLVSRRLGVSRQLCSRWSAKHRWIERVRELETEAAIAATEAQAEARRKAAEKVAMRIEEHRLAFVQAEIQAAKKLMERANEVLAQPFGDVKPDAAAKMFLAAHNIGSAVLGLPALTVKTDLQQPVARQITNIVVQRDSQSDQVAKIYADFFARPENSSHPQAERFRREYAELVAERGKPPDGSSGLFCERPARRV